MTMPEMTWPPVALDTSNSQLARDKRPGPWLNARQAVRYLNLPSRKALYQAVRRGQVPVHRFGKRLRFNTAELDRVLGKRV